jgi:hypothetical protein
LLNISESALYKFTIVEKLAFKIWPDVQVHISRIVRYHSGGSKKLNARILHLVYMVYNLNTILY